MLTTKILIDTREQLPFLQGEKTSINVGDYTFESSDYTHIHVDRKSHDDFIGTFLYLGDDELVVIKRTLVGDKYNDEELKYITNSRELYNFFLSLHKNKK
jgi:hypothetical protein